MALSSTKCYWPNGQEVTQYNYQPCNAGSDPQHAGCCDLRTSVCTEYGYCIGNANYYYRGGCTDKTWMSSSCAQECSFADEAYLGDFTNFYDCGNGSWTDNKSWCCGRADGASCCDHTFSIYLGRPYFPTSSVAGANSATATTAVTSSASGSNVLTTGTSSTDNTQKASNTKTLGVAVGVGVGVGALVLAAMAYFVCRERKRRVRLERKYEAILAIAPAREGGFVNIAHQPPTEKDATTSARSYEVPAQQQRYEVQG